MSASNSLSIAMSESIHKSPVTLVDSALVIERSYRRMKLKNSLKVKIKTYTAQFALLQQSIAEVDKSKSFDKAQSIICAEPFSKALSALVEIMPFHVFNNLKANQSQRLKMRRIIVSACVIARFPENVLYTEESEEQSWESNNCLLSALTFTKHFNAFLVYALHPNTPYRTLETALLNLYFALHLFLKSFEKWQIEDKLRTVKTLEDSFIEGYTAFIASKASVLFHGNDPLLLHTSEAQLAKVKEMMQRLLGKAAADARMEELCASIEASMPIFSQVKAFEENAKKQSNSNNSTPAKSSNSTILSSSPTTSSVLSELQQQHQPTAASVTAQQSPSVDSHAPPSPLVLDSSNLASMKYLEKLSTLTGMSPEQLTHEITLDKFYRLPVERPTLDSTNSSGNSSTNISSIDASTTDTPTLALKIRATLLAGMADRITNSLKLSSIDNPNQVKIGDVIPIRFAPNHYEPPAELLNNDPVTSNAGEGVVYDPAAAPVNPPIVSAKVLAIHTTASKENSSSTSGEVEGFSVEYIYENGIKEEHVSVKRLKLSSHRTVDPSIFLSTLYDLCIQILSFTPNRHDLVNNMFTAVDFKLLQQMLINNALNPVHDLLPVFQYIQRAIVELQSPGRIAETQEWMRQLGDSFHINNNSSSESKTFQEVVPLLPAFFEKATDCIEDIQRDMANFYIAALVPTMQTHGAPFLSKCFLQRLAMRMTSLDATASLVLSQLNAATFPLLAADCVEAGVCLNVDEFNLTALVSGTKSLLLKKAVVARAFITLLQLPVRLDSRQASRIVPETLVFDVTRLSAIRDYIDKISLESSIVITSRQILSKYQVAFKDTEEIELQHRLDVLLTENDVNLSSISVEVAKYVKFAIYRSRESFSAVHRASPAPGSAAAASVSPRPPGTPVINSVVVANYDLKELQERVEKTLSDVIAPGNPVLTLFTKRLYKILLRVMLGQSITEKLTQYSLNSKGQERNITQLLDNVVRLFNHIYNVHGELYGSIIQSFVNNASTGSSSSG